MIEYFKMTGGKTFAKFQASAIKTQNVLCLTTLFKPLKTMNIGYPHAGIFESGHAIKNTSKNINLVRKSTRDLDKVQKQN